MVDFFSTRNIAFTILDYPMSWVEFIGTILYLLSVILIAQRRILTWPIGIASSIFYVILFYQIQLYADSIEQIYYIGASIYGWWFWNKQLSNGENDAAKVPVFYSPKKMLGITVALTLILSVIVGLFISQAHIILPAIFPLPAAFPYLDALTTVMSFVAMWLMARKRVESWVYWIIVDVICIGLYFAQNVRFLSLLYVILLVMAVNGFIRWHREANPSKPAPTALKVRTD